MAYSTEVLADSPVGYWRLGEASGTTAADSSGNGLSGTYTGSYALGYAGLDASSADDALDLQFAAGHVALGNPAGLQITGSITVECLFVPHAWPGTTGIHCLISKGYDGTNQGYALDILNTSGTMSLRFGTYNNGAGNTIVTYNVTGWTLDVAHHLAGTFDGSQWKLYVDGALAATLTNSQGPRSTGSNAILGGFVNISPVERRCNGILDECAIYNTALSATRISTHAFEAGYGSGPGAGSTTPINVITPNQVTAFASAARRAA